MVDSSAHADFSAQNLRGSVAAKAFSSTARSASATGTDEAWRGELAEKLQAYRARRRKVAPNLAQGSLPFDERATPPKITSVVAVDDPEVLEAAARSDDNDFSFTIAIGRNAVAREDSRMVIDVSQPPAALESEGIAPAGATSTEQQGMYPVASIEERRLAGLIDAACLTFAYGGFLTLFGSLGGQFTFSKLSAVVCVTTFVIVYLQYFARSACRELYRRHAHTASNALAERRVHALCWNAIYGFPLGHVGRRQFNVA